MVVIDCKKEYRWQKSLEDREYIEEQKKRRKSPINTSCVIVELFFFGLLIFVSRIKITPAEFEPSKYPDYVALDEQIEVLKNLDLAVSEKAVNACESIIEAREYDRIQVEGHPYYKLLIEEGTPVHDESGEKIYSSQVYWMDYQSSEVFPWKELIGWIQSLSDGELIFEDISEHHRARVFGSTSGGTVLTLAFSCNGNRYKFERERSSYEDVLAFLSEVLKKEQCQEKLYICRYYNSGILLFYRDETWAEEFMEQTGLELSESVQ